MPEGVSHTGVFGESREVDALKIQSALVANKTGIVGYANSGGGTAMPASKRSTANNLVTASALTATES
jgi:hypothetical protein